MFYSQKASIKYDLINIDSDIDMRGVWSSGKAKECFPFFFSLSDKNKESQDYINNLCNEYISVDESLDKLNNILLQFNKELFFCNLCENSKGFSAVRTFIKDISYFDQIYFQKNDRLNYLLRTYFPRGEIRYYGPLFM